MIHRPATPPNGHLGLIGLALLYSVAMGVVNPSVAHARGAKVAVLVLAPEPSWPHSWFAHDIGVSVVSPDDPSMFRDRAPLLDEDLRLLHKAIHRRLGRINPIHAIPLKAIEAARARVVAAASLPDGTACAVMPDLKAALIAEFPDALIARTRAHCNVLGRDCALTTEISGSYEERALGRIPDRMEVRVKGRAMARRSWLRAAKKLRRPALRGVSLGTVSYSGGRRATVLNASLFGRWSSQRAAVKALIKKGTKAIDRCVRVSTLMGPATWGLVLDVDSAGTVVDAWAGPAASGHEATAPGLSACLRGVGATWAFEPIATKKRKSRRRRRKKAGATRRVATSFLLRGGDFRVAQVVKAAGIGTSDAVLQALLDHPPAREAVDRCVSRFGRKAPNSRWRATLTVNPDGHIGASEARRVLEAQAPESTGAGPWAACMTKAWSLAARQCMVGGQPAVFKVEVFLSKRPR